MDEDLLNHLLFDEMDADEALNVIMDSSSDEEEKQWGGSSSGKASNKERDFLAANNRVVRNYFSGRNSVHDEVDFERRFRVPRAVFNRAHDHLMGTDPFVHKIDATKKPGMCPLVKMVGCFRHLACGDAFDRDDENLCIAQSTLRDYVRDFCKLVKVAFGKECLNRSPTKEEKQVTSDNVAREDFPGCLGSWDCKHFSWKNCPMRLAGQHRDKDGDNSLTLEAFVDHRECFWKVNFGDAGSLNDVNVLDKSSIVLDILSGELDMTIEPHTVNDNERDWMHFLADGTCPEWSIFINTFSDETDPTKRAFAQRQEAVRKDIECAFGTLAQRFHILQRPLRQWCLQDIKDALDCCVISHNMTVECRAGALDDDPVVQEATAGRFPLFGGEEITLEDAVRDGINLALARLDAFDDRVKSSYEHQMLKRDLMEALARKKSRNDN